MEQNNNKALVLAIGKFSDLLIREKLIDPSTDGQALFKAMRKVANQLMSSDVQPSPSPSPSPYFVTGPLASIMSKYEKSQSKVQELRKLQNQKELSELQSKPAINHNSSSLVKKMPPLHLRTAKVLKDLKSKKESQRILQKLNEEENFSKTCTFRPLSRERDSNRSHNSTSKNSRNSSRSIDLLTKDLYTWEDNRKKKVADRVHSKQMTETKLLETKPRIDEMSQKLSKERSATPVHERLAKSKTNSCTSLDFTFVPQITERSREILRKKRKEDERKVKKALQKFSDVEYKINSSGGSFDQQRNLINICKISNSTSIPLIKMYK